MGNYHARMEVRQELQYLIRQFGAPNKQLTIYDSRPIFYKYGGDSPDVTGNDRFLFFGDLFDILAPMNESQQLRTTTAANWVRALDGHNTGSISKDILWETMMAVFNTPLEEAEKYMEEQGNTKKVSLHQHIADKIDKMTGQGPGVLPRAEEQWLQIVRAHELLPTERARPRGPGGKGAINSPRYQARDAAVKYFYVRINEVRGIRLPIFYREYMGVLYHRVQVSFFDFSHKKFFGTTWLGPKQKLDMKDSGVTVRNQGFMFRTSIHDESCCALVEHVVLLCDPNTGMTQTKFGAGWAIMPLFDQNLHQLKDIEEAAARNPAADNQLDDGRNNVLQTKSDVCTVYLNKGTPRAVLKIDFDQYKIQTTMKKRADDALLKYQVFSFNALASFSHLFRENEIIGQDDVLAGFPSLPSDRCDTSRVAEEGGLQKGNRLPADPRQLGTYSIPFYKLLLRNPSVSLPPNFSERLLQTFGYVRSTHWKNDPQDVHTVLPGHITHRYLRFGVHNGRKYLQPPDQVELVPKQAMTDIAHSLETKRTVSSGMEEVLYYDGSRSSSYDLQCVPDASLAVVFELVFEISWLDPHPGVTKVVVGWSMRLMDTSRLDRDNILRLDGTRQSICLLRGPRRTLANERVFGLSEIRHPGEDRTPHNIWLTMQIEEITDMGQPPRKYPEDQQVRKPQLLPNSHMDPNMSTNNMDQTLPLPNLDESSIPHASSPPAHRSDKNLQLRMPSDLHNKIRTPTMDNMRIHSPFGKVNTNASQTILLDSPHHHDQQHSHFPKGQTTGTQTDMDHPSILNYPSQQLPDGPNDIMFQGHRASAAQRQLFAGNPQYGVGRSSLLFNPHAMPDNATTVPGVIKGLSGIDIDVELACPLKECEILINFYQFFQIHEHHLTHNTQSIRIAFNFYNKPLHITDKLRLVPTTEDAEQLKEDEKQSSESRVFARNEIHKYDLNGGTSLIKLPFAEYRQWVEYMYTKELELQIYDGDTMLLIGSGNLRLQQFLRQGESVLERRAQVDIIDQRLATSIRDEEELHGLPDGVAIGSLSIFIKHAARRLPIEQEQVLMIHDQRSIPSSGSCFNAIKTHPTLRNVRSTRYHDPLEIVLNDTAGDGSKNLPQPMWKSNPNLTKSMTGLDEFVGLLDDGETGQMALPLIESPLYNYVHGSCSPKGKSRQGRNPSGSRQNKNGGKKTNRLKPLSRAKIEAFSMERVNRINLDPKAADHKYQTQKRIRKANLETVRQYRESKKQAVLQEVFQEAVTQYRVIQPSFGELVFFELKFVNPYPRKCKFRISIDDPAFPRSRATNVEDLQALAASDNPELTAITDVKEWRTYWAYYGLQGDRRYDIFTPAPGRTVPEEADPVKYIILDKNEEVYIPFKFQSFRSGFENEIDEGYPLPGMKKPPVPVYPPIASRIATINIESAESHVLAYMRLDIRPRTFAIDKTIHFHATSETTIDQLVALPNERFKLGHDRFPNPARTDAKSRDLSTSIFQETVPITDHQQDADFNIQANSRIQHIHCTASEGLQYCDFTHRDAGPRAIRLRYQAGQYPNTNRFYLVLYSDIFGCKLHSIYRVYIHSHLRHYIGAETGRKEECQIFLPMFKNSHTVQMFTNNPSEIDLKVEEPFLVQPGDNQTKFEFDYRTVSCGRKCSLFHLVDIETQTLLASWLLEVHSVYPKVTGTTPVNLTCGRLHRKHFIWDNNSTFPKTFYFDSSNPDLMRLPQEQIDIAPLRNARVFLQFPPQSVPGNKIIFLHIVDNTSKRWCKAFDVTWA